MDQPQSLGWVAVAIAALAGLVAGLLLARRAPGPSAAPAPSPPTPEPEVAQEEPGAARLYALAESFRSFYESSAHPADLLANDAFCEGVRLLRDPSFGQDDLLDYLNGDSGPIACLAAQALRERRAQEPDAVARVLPNIGTFGTWPLYFALRYLHEAAGDTPVVGRVLVSAVNYTGWRQTAEFLTGFVRDRAAAGERPVLGDELGDLDADDREKLERFVSKLDREVRGSLLEDHRAWQRRHGDAELLRSVGSVWDDADDADDADLVDDADQEATAAEIEAELLAEHRRSVLLVGEPGVGKTAIAERVGRKLQARGWIVFEASAMELVAGQVYIGELEERLRQLLARLRGTRRILWIVPEFQALSRTGRHKYSSVSALDAMLPDLELGRIAVLGECQPGAFERLVIDKPRVVGAMVVQRVEPASRESTLGLARRWLDRHALVNEPARLLEEAWQLAEQFLGDRAAPGRLLRLLRVTTLRLAGGDARQRPQLRVDDLIATLGQMTGLPANLLDDRQPLDLEALRALFARRVVGQQEAVDCLVERVAMVKAGLTDPTRPFGVYLFAGPTGTGKTEIAKTLAEFLFGSAERMLRIDMSELQGYEDVDRLIGSEDPERTEALVDRIRKQPFSVVLLDEFEKAHRRIWDLFLQVFDDGRLTDRRGDTADFRYAIVILTSNLGSVIEAGARLGFAGSGDPQGDFSPVSVMRTVTGTFRPEFLNRLDRVVVFRPLDREVMRRILLKELDDVFLRRGLRSRAWAVEWDPSAIEFLLENGFTPDLGARPLRRAVERHLLAPLAHTIVTHQVPQGDQFLYVTRAEDGLVVEFIDPDAPAGGAVPAPEAGALTLRAIALAPAGSDAEVAFAADAHARLRAVVEGAAWTEKRESALEMTQLSEFWLSPDRFEILGQVETQGRIEAGVRRTGSLVERLRKREGGAPANLIQSLAHNLYLLELAVADVEAARPQDAFLCVEGDGFTRDLAEMYAAWARKRRMTVTVLEDRDAVGAEDARYLVAVSGYGAHTILAAEEGVHLLEVPADRGRGFARSKAHVRVVAQSGAPPDDGVRGLRRAAERALAEYPRALRVVRRYREQPSPLVRDGVRGWRTGRLDQVLAGDFDLIA